MNEEYKSITLPDFTSKEKEEPAKLVSIGASKKEISDAWDVMVARVKESWKDGPTPICSNEEACEIVQQFLDKEDPFVITPLSWLQKLFHRHKWKRAYPFFNQRWRCQCGAERPTVLKTDQWGAKYEHFE